MMGVLRVILVVCLTSLTSVGAFDLEEFATAFPYKGDGQPISIEDDQYKFIGAKTECCHSEPHSVTLDINNDGVTDCTVYTTRCSGGCPEYSNSSGEVKLWSGTTKPTTLGTVCPGSGYYDGGTCCSPTKSVYVRQTCGKYIIYVERPSGCDCGPCRGKPGKCYLRNDKRIHEFYINRWHRCSTTVEVDLPYCVGNCPGYHSHTYGTVTYNNKIYKLSQEKKSCSCCRSTGLKSQQVTVNCRYQINGGWYTYTQTTNLATISGCDCTGCSRTSLVNPDPDIQIIKAADIPFATPEEVEEELAKRIQE